MRVAFFFDARSLKPWDWQRFLSGQVGMSGTNAQLLLLAHRLQARGTKVALFHTLDPGPHPSIDQFIIDDASGAVRRAKELAVDLLIFNNRGDDVARAMVAASKALQQAVIVWDQNGPTDEMGNHFAASGMVKRVICVSATQADHLRHHPVFSKVSFIHNAVDVSLFPRGGRRDPRSVVFVGAVAASKGFHHLAAIWPEVKRQIPQARLTVLGSAELHQTGIKLGPLRAGDAEFEMRHITPHLGHTLEEAANHGVFFEGLVAPAQLRRVLSQAAVGIVNPNWQGSWETFCVSAVEVQAAGAAVVGGRAGGLKETVGHGITGLLISSRRQLRDALISLLTTDRALALGNRGPAWVAERFSPNVIVPQWESMLFEVLNGSIPELPFSLRRMSKSTLLKELYRQATRAPLIGSRLPSFLKVRTVARRISGARRRP